MEKIFQEMGEPLMMDIFLGFCRVSHHHSELPVFHIAFWDEALFYFLRDSDKRWRKNLVMVLSDWRGSFHSMPCHVQFRWEDQAYQVSQKWLIGLLCGT